MEFRLTASNVIAVVDGAQMTFGGHDEWELHVPAYAASEFFNGQSVTITTPERVSEREQRERELAAFLNPPPRRAREWFSAD
jgi:hypothetical protein